jgi:hypothetical protein
MFYKFTLSVFIFIRFFAYTQQATSVDSKVLQLNTITTAMPFLSINPDSRSGALGDAGTALSPNANSLFWNTAGISFSKNKLEIGGSVVPWLRQLTNDINLYYIAGYTKFNERNALAFSVRQFTLGEITYTDQNGAVLRPDKPSEQELAVGYSLRLTEEFSLGVNGKFAYSNLTGGLITAGAQTKAGVAGAADISFMYQNTGMQIGGKSGELRVGATINNVGNKISYSANASSDFLPTSLKLGSSYTTKVDNYNSIAVTMDLQKLLVPSPAIYSNNTMIAGKSSNVGVITGIFQSFSDAPGTPLKLSNNKYDLNTDGTAKIVKGSRLKEELSEITISGGVEYNYNKVFAVRGGYFHESKNKGARQFFTFGAGLKYNIMQIDISYIAALQRNSPLANTLRFSLLFTIKTDQN